MFNRKQYCKSLAAGLLLLAAGSAQAIPVTYNFTITGTVEQLGTKTVKVTKSNGTVESEDTTTESNAYGLDVNDTITAFGTFTADLGTIGSETGTVYFDLAAFSANGNTLTIDTNGTQNIQLLASDDVSYSSGGGPYLTFLNGALTDFDYLKSAVSPKFNSSFMNFDDMTSGSSSSTSQGKTTTTTYQAMLGTWNENVVLTPIPEADTYAMMLAGLCLIGFTVLRRRSF